MKIIPFNNMPLGEARTVRFLGAFGRKQETARIVSFGKCNFKCPYCIRDAQFVDEHGDVISSVEVPEEKVFERLRQALDEGERVRLSGGDPCMFPNESRRIAELCRSEGERISICHNGSNPKFIQMLSPDIEYAAIDLKAIDVGEYALRAGVSQRVASLVLPNFLRTCAVVLSDSRALLDVRTCVFDTTSLEHLRKFAELILSLNGKDRLFWTIRQYIPVPGLDWKPLHEETLYEFAEELSHEYPNLKIGVRNAWRGGDFLYWSEGLRFAL